MTMVYDFFDRARHFIGWWAPRPRKRRQITRSVVAAILLIGLLTSVSYDALQLAVLVGIYVELMMRKPESPSRPR